MKFILVCIWISIYYFLLYIYIDDLFVYFHIFDFFDVNGYNGRSAFSCVYGLQLKMCTG